MKNAGQAGRFIRSGGYLDSWDKVAGWVLLLTLVLSGTQVLPAQHSQSQQDPGANQKNSETTPLHDDSANSAEERKHWSAEPGCSDREPGLPDRMTSRSWTLASPDGLFQAYSENEAITERSPTGEITLCKSTSRLFVTGPGMKEAKAVLIVEPSEEDGWENSIELIDWSREGHRLVVIEFSWLWATDSAGVAPRVYDADSGKLTADDFSYAAFQRLLGRKCIVNLDPIGFTPDGKVVLDARPDFDEEMQLMNDSCLKKTEVWSLDP